MGGALLLDGDPGTGRGRRRRVGDDVDDPRLTRRPVRDATGSLRAKLAVVSVAAGLGGYNHLRLRPQLEPRPDDPALARELRTTLSIESIAFVVVIALTAVLVAAAT